MHRCKLPCCVYTGVSRDQQTITKFDESNKEFVNKKVYQDHCFSFANNENKDDGDKDFYDYSSSDEEEEQEAITPIGYNDEGLFCHDDINGLDTYLATTQERFIIRNKISTFYSIVGNNIIGNDKDNIAFFFTQQQLEYRKTERLTDLIDALQYNVKKMKMLTTMMPKTPLDQRLK